MSDGRPDPDTLLAEIIKKEEDANRGKLKIFFGYAAGVGKTYAMLEAAHLAKSMGIDVVAGYIEPHNRPATIELMKNLEILPTLKVKRKGIVLNEFDIDEAIKRHPELILVDELAHTNAFGCRNLKRYQDIDELLNAGIDVYTTVNVQHIESLNDMVYQITKIQVNERIPDKVLDAADKIELVDIEPEALIERLNEGKVYKNTQAKRALQNFFTVENLIALREIALRRTADQINIKSTNEIFPVAHEYYTNEHILICLSSSPSNAKVIRTASRMAKAFHGTFTALFVETPDTKELIGENKSRLRSNLKLAEQLGAKIVTVYGENVPEQIAEYAKSAGVSKLVIGRSNNKKSLFSKQSLVDALTKTAPNLDIYIIPDIMKPYIDKNTTRRLRLPSISYKDSIKTILILLIATVLSFFSFNIGLNVSNAITIFLLSILLIAVETNGSVYSIISSLLSVLILNYFFTEPRFTFKIDDISHVINFAVMFIVAVLTSSISTKMKDQSFQNTLKARVTEVLLETSQKLQKASNKEEIYDLLGNQIFKLFDFSVIIYPVLKDNELSEPITLPCSSKDNILTYLSTEERAVANWVLKNNKNAGATTHTLTNAKCLYMAVRGQHSVYAVVGIAVNKNEVDIYKKNLLISMLGEFGLALEKESINEAKNEIYVQAKQEQLRANLLRAISHDLRTPLTAISGNASFLISKSAMLTKEKKCEIYEDIYDDSMWLINLVENLLSVTRIDNGTMDIQLQPELLDEVIDEALKHINRKSSEYKITVDLPNELLMAKMDSRLIVQVIINIIDNAIKYTPEGTEITIRARIKNKENLVIEIADNGNGIIENDKDRIFDMFFTANKNTGDSRRGLGLGLSLCKSIITAHGGEISVRDNLPHGTVFSFTLQAKEVQIYE